MSLAAETQNEIEAILKNLADAYARRDLPGFLEHFAPDREVLLYGTGGDEKRIGLEQIGDQATRDWEQSESAEWAFTWISVDGSDNIAWVATDGAFHFLADGEEISLPVRGTFVLEKRHGKWVIVQSHFSIPATGQEEGQSF